MSNWRTMNEYSDSISAMGTFLMITLSGPAPSVLREATREAFHQVRLLERQMSIHLPESEISFINAYASKRPLRIEKGLFDLLMLVLDYNVMTGGAFDVTVGSFCDGGGSSRGVRLNPVRQSVRFVGSGVRIDLNAIAKGYAVDRIVNLLSRRGIASAFINFGSSSMYGLGRPSGRRAWWVPLVDPSDQEKQVAVAGLVNQSLSCSGNYLSGRPTFEENPHILDPATGAASWAVLGAAVVAASAVESEALSTAICVAGRAAARRFVRERDGVSALVFERRQQTARASGIRVFDCSGPASAFRVSTRPSQPAGVIHDRKSVSE